mmetsp:Transcript_49065/g.96736  ORF Transcript_49065/g.96736 Transcript_49065/m.96736 type:complete len:352 (+) Transcript_49065:1507-2562(+)
MSEDFCAVWMHMPQHDCLDLDGVKKICLETPLLELPLAMILPGDQSLGLCAKAFYARREERQRYIIASLAESGGFTPQSLEGDPFGCREEHMFVFIPSEHLFPMLPSFIAGNLSLSAGGTHEFAYLKQLQDQLVEVLDLRKKALLANELEEMIYSDSAPEKSLLSKLHYQLPQTISILREIEKELRRLTIVAGQRDPALAQAILSFVLWFCGIPVRFETSVNAGLKDFASISGLLDANNLLSLDQRLGRDILLSSSLLRETLQLEYLRAVAAWAWAQSPSIPQRFAEEPCEEIKGWIEQASRAVHGGDHGRRVSLLAALCQFGLEQLFYDSQLNQKWQCSNGLSTKQKFLK